MTIRLAAKHAPRYAYQDAKDHFYESNEIILKILNKYLEQNPLNSLTRLKWKFNEDIAKLSRYNPELWRNKYKSSYEAQEAQDQEALTSANAQLDRETEAKRAKKEELFKKLAGNRSRMTSAKK